MKKIKVDIEYDNFDPYSIGDPYYASVFSKKRKFGSCTIGKSIKDVKDQMRGILNKKGWKESEYTFKYNSSKERYKNRIK